MHAILMGLKINKETMNCIYGLDGIKRGWCIFEAFGEFAGYT